MIRLGIDFDNTIVEYDNLFNKIALEYKLIDRKTKTNKIDLREILRSRGEEELFTNIQGEVYGKRILEADSSKGVIAALKNLNYSEIKPFIISHKTKTPYKGPKYDLHKAARDWLTRNNFFNKDGLNWNKKDVYFEVSKEKKIKRILSLNCTHYIDDLPEILELLPKSISRILYDPNSIYLEKNFLRLSNWENLKDIL